MAQASRICHGVQKPCVVLQPIREISGLIKLPGSKSLSNRILLLAALSEVQFSLVVMGWAGLPNKRPGISDCYEPDFTNLTGYGIKR